MGLGMIDDSQLRRRPAIMNVYAAFCGGFLFASPSTSPTMFLFRRWIIIVLLAINGLTIEGVTYNVDVNLNCDVSGNPAYCSIQSAINAATSGDVVLINDGTYVENIVVKSGITITSQNGRDFTTIQGISGAGAGALGTVLISAFATTSLTISRLTIIGIDNGSPGIENAAIYLQNPGTGTHTSITIQDNTIVADGEAGLLFEFNARADIISITNNVFSGKTYTGTTPGGCGFSNPPVANVPRQLVIIGGGSTVTNTKNVLFTGNQVTGTAGDASSACTNPPYQGNTLVTIDVVTATISDNTFSGQTSRFATSLRARGTDTMISNNVFTDANLLPSACYILLDTIGSGAINPSLNNVASQNTFNKPTRFFAGTAITMGAETAGSVCADIPSNAPSRFPTIQPSTFPSARPSRAPSRAPSVSPSKMPSVMPSSMPYAVPSLDPTSSPSTAPSISARPSNRPSVMPSSMPYAVPSLDPTSSPSTAPSISARRSNRPSLMPSSSPSKAPFDKCKKLGNVPVIGIIFKILCWIFGIFVSKLIK